jgi:hypothetical protein
MKTISVSRIETRPEFHAGGDRDTHGGTGVDNLHGREFSDDKAGESDCARRKAGAVTITNCRDALESRESSIGGVEREEG